VTGQPVVAVHGGAGGGRAASAEHHEALAAAVDAARGALAAGGSALDAAVAAVVLLEDCPLYNAGRGSVPTADGTFETDAAVMDGDGRRAGAVAAVTGVRNPVLLARAVMEETPHVLLVGAGAERLAARVGLESRGREWFAERGDAHEPGDAGGVGATGGGSPGGGAAAAGGGGTVGAVVRDAGGRLAAATSTGGMRGQLAGRVGDTPVLGAGTWADDRVAVSATGDGEAMIRTSAAHEVAALVRHAGLPLADAAARVVGAIGPLGGAGGLFAVDRDGALALPFSTPALARGWATGEERARTAIGRD
jgi:beta-aspartyl-peptidase (threonine type)